MTLFLPTRPGPGMLLCPCDMAASFPRVSDPRESRADATLLFWPALNVTWCHSWCIFHYKQVTESSGPQSREYRERISGPILNSPCWLIPQDADWAKGWGPRFPHAPWCAVRFAQWIARPQDLSPPWDGGHLTRLSRHSEEGRGEGNSRPEELVSWV